MEEIFSMLSDESIDINYFDIPSDFSEDMDLTDLYKNLKAGLFFN